jgi:hypothetical protein
VAQILDTIDDPTQLRTLSHGELTQLAQEIRGLDSSLPIILMSGSASLPAGELAYVDAHIGRGSSIEDLTHLMNDLMETDRAVVQPLDTALQKTVPFAPGWR